MVMNTHSHPSSLTCLAHSPSGLVSMVTTAGMVSLAETKRKGGRSEAQTLVEWLN